MLQLRMTVIPSVDDRVLFRSNNLPQVLRVADVTAVLAPVLGIQRVNLWVWGSWPADMATGYTFGAAAQAVDLLGITLLLPATWRSIVEIPNWRSYIGT